jgi:hypothetical protein
LGTFERNPKFGDLEGGENQETWGLLEQTLNLGIWEQTIPLIWKQSPIKVLKLFWLILNKAFSKILSWSLKKKERFCVIFRNKNLTTKI